MFYLLSYYSAVEIIEQWQNVFVDLNVHKKVNCTVLFIITFCITTISNLGFGSS